MQEISFYKPSIDARESELIARALKSQSTEIIDEFEAKLREYFNSKHAIITYNAAAAHHLSLCAMDIKRGDKIVCSVNAFPSVAQSIRHFDAEPLFVDIDENDFNMDPTALRSVIEKNNHKKLRAIFVTHIAGQPARLDEIYKIANEYDIKVLDDANKAIGMKYDGKKVGNTGSLISCFQISSQIKNPVATAGFLLTNNDDIAARAQLLRNYALLSDIDKYGNLGYIYDVVDIGVKYDITTLNAAYALAQFEKNDKFIARRQQIAAYYDEQLAQCPHLSTPLKLREHAYSQYIIKIDKNRDDFARRLLEAGIHTSLHYIPIHLLSYYKNKYDLKVNDFPNALKVYQQVLSLPIYNALSDAEVEHICQSVKHIAQSR